MKDAWAVALKEWRELVGQQGMQGRQGMLLFIGAFGLLLPMMNGREWITSPVLPLAWAWVPMFLVGNVIADAFAGERERHTLETLLASRLSEAAILFGKMGAAIGYSAVLCVVSLVTGLVVVNVVSRGQGLALYPAQTLAAMFTIGILGAMLTAALGSVISLRTPTVRQAQQTLGAMIFVMFLLPAWGLRSLIESWRPDPQTLAVSGGQIAVIAVGLFVLVDAGLVVLALSRFRRDRLLAP